MVSIEGLKKLLGMLLKFESEFENLDRATKEEWWSLYSHADEYSEYIAEKIKEAEEYELVR